MEWRTVTLKKLAKNAIIYTTVFICCMAAIAFCYATWPVATVLIGIMGWVFLLDWAIDDEPVMGPEWKRRKLNGG